ncbi:hypothetical protein ACFWCH_09155 [Microbacterium sp. NPDC060132]|uniref:hypothetical protein n=1 Tax=unclassified Microbacterium TaxID=2609290 RepID=UPI0036632F7E
MAVFGRRRREIDVANTRAESADAAAPDDDALRALEDLFSTLPPPPPRPALRAHALVDLDAGPALLPTLTPGGDDPIAPTPGTPLIERDTSLDRTRTEPQGERMAQLEQSVQELLTIDGAVGVAIADSASGMALAQGGHPAFDLGVAAAGNSNVVRAKLQTMKELGIASRIDDILITLDDQYHLINVLSSSGTEGLFVYLVLDKAKANLALARHKLATVAGQITI